MREAGMFDLGFDLQARLGLVSQYSVATSHLSQLAGSTHACIVLD